MRTLSPTLERLTEPWSELVRPVRYSTTGYGIVLVRLLGVAAITLNRRVYILGKHWRDDVGTAALLVHEALHVRQQRSMGWWRFLLSYLWWRVRHPRTPIRHHPLEAPAYDLADEVGRHWHERPEAGIGTGH
jgi:hypothetical protein